MTLAEALYLRENVTMKIKRICILGGTGFVGGHLVNQLAKQGYSLKLLTRNRERHRKFIVMPNVELVNADLFASDTLMAEFRGCDAVINLIGILNGSEQQFQTVHAELPQRVIAACQATGIKRYLHMSALNANNDNVTSEYLKSKAAGNQAAHQGAEHGIGVTSFAPSVIFGPGDSFFNRFAALLKMSPVLPLACPNARFAPVYVGDVAAAMQTALSNESTIGQHYELCGPRIYTLRELVEYTAQLIGHKRVVWGLSDKMSLRQAKVFDWLFKWLPGDTPFSVDNYQSLQLDSICNQDGLGALGIHPKSVESIMPRLLGGEHRSARYHQFRGLSRR